MINSKKLNKTSILGSLGILSMAIAGNMAFAESASAAFGVRFSTDSGFAANTLSDPYQTLTVFDGGAGDTPIGPGPHNGTINIVGANVGGTLNDHDWTVIFTGATSSSSTTPGDPLLDIDSFMATSNKSGTQTLYFEVYDEGYTPEVDAFLSSLSSSVLSSGATLSVDTYVGDGSADFDDKDNSLASLSLVSIPPTGTSSIDLFPAGASAPYSLLISGSLIHSGAQTSNFDASIQDTPVPEPLTILGSGIALAFGGYMKRKLKQNADA